MHTNSNLIVDDHTEKHHLLNYNTHVFKLKFNKKTFDIDVEKNGSLDGLILTKHCGKHFSEWRRRSATLRCAAENKIDESEYYQNFRITGKIQKVAMLRKPLAINLAQWISADVHKQLLKFYEDTNIDIINTETAVETENEKLKNQIRPFNYDRSLRLNNISIIARASDGYINLNQICKAGNKHFKKWNENKKSQAFLEVLLRRSEFGPTIF